MDFNQITPEKQSKQEDKLKLAALRRLAKSAFAEIDAGEFELVAPTELDRFIDRIDAKARSANAR